MLKKNNLSYISKSPEQTIHLGTVVGKCIQPGDIVVLAGDLGSGKTQFARGMAYGLGVSPDTYITSPSFALINEYQGKIPLYHFDLYRLGDKAEIEDLGYEEYFFGQGVSVVEWGEKFPGIFPLEHFIVEIKYREENIRELKFTGTGKRFLNILNKLEERIEINGLGGSKIRGNIGC